MCDEVDDSVEGAEEEEVDKEVVEYGSIVFVVTVNRSQASLERERRARGRPSDTYSSEKQLGYGWLLLVQMYSATNENCETTNRLSCFRLTPSLSIVSEGDGLYAYADYTS